MLPPSSDPEHRHSRSASNVLIRRWTKCVPAADAKIEVLAGGFTWTEGPVWVDDEAGGHLLFSDIPRNSIFRWSEARGIELFMNPSGYTGVSYYGLEPGTNGLALDAQRKTDRVRTW